MKIVVMSGPDDGRAFELKSFPIMIGRHSTDDVFLALDRSVSRHHARISWEGGSYAIEDVGFRGRGSTNGTFLNAERITQKKTINPGDLFLLGRVLLKFDIVSKINTMELNAN
jgi:pSer/pThr/pTyr-binding forkhead associated (FHA) protein